jgi:hypothetical protein
MPWSIARYTSPIGITLGAGQHNTLALVDPTGKVIKELNGGAGNGSGGMTTTALYGTLFGKEGDLALAGSANAPRFETNPTYTNNGAVFEAILVSGSQADIMARWEAGKLAVQDINSRNYLYLPVGAQNSNSFVHTVEQVMTGTTVNSQHGDWRGDWFISVRWQNRQGPVRPEIHGGRFKNSKV